jgi:histidyl-tRNA synthetase
MTRMDPQFNTEYFKIVRYLRERGFRIELYCGESSKFKQQMKYADRLRIPIVLILGEEEHQQGLIKVRSMEGEREEGNTDAKEKDVALEALPETLKKMLQERQNS